MDKINVIPLEKVADVSLGMKRCDVRKCFGDAKEFKKSKFSKTVSDDFGFCHVFYNQDDSCEAIEIFPETEVFIDGKKVFPSTIEESKKVLVNLQQDGEDYIDTEKSIGIYAPNGKMESILFGVNGYYE